MEKNVVICVRDIYGREKKEEVVGVGIYVEQRVCCLCVTLNLSIHVVRTQTLSPTPQHNPTLG